jgi:hypothetical protein
MNLIDLDHPGALLTPMLPGKLAGPISRRENPTPTPPVSTETWHNQFTLQNLLSRAPAAAVAHLSPCSMCPLTHCVLNTKRLCAPLITCVFREPEDQCA